MYVDIITPCHKCEVCLKARQRLWTARALQEVKDSVRTWWGTLTLSPDTWMLALSRARAREAAQGVDYDLLPPDEKFRLWDAQVKPEITKFLKRVRAQSAAPLRYLLVTEAHESGVPHYHALVHECDPAKPVRKRVLDSQWTLGEIKQWRLVSDRRPAHYVCKYLSKDARTRILASQDYGSSPYRQSSQMEDMIDYVDT